jgi:hypothetical protein
MPPLGKLLIIVGLATTFIGLWVMFGPRIPWLGKLPGDILIKRGPTTFYFPIVTCLVVSVVLTLLFRFFGRR